MKTLREWWPVVSTVLSLLATLVILPVIQLIRTLKNNHLAHIEKRLERIEEKLDRHILFHLEKKDG